MLGIGVVGADQVDLRAGHLILGGQRDPDRPQLPRQQRVQGRDPLLDLLEGAGHVVVIGGEGQDQRRGPVLGVAGQRVEAAHVLQDLLEAERHQPLDLDRAGARQLGGHRDRAGLQPGQQRAGHVEEGHGAEDQDGHRHQVDQQAAIDEEGKQRPHRHTCGSAPRSAASDSRA